MFRSLGSVAVLSCAGVGRAVTVRIHALAEVFAVERRNGLTGISFWRTRSMVADMSPTRGSKAAT